MTPLQFTRSVRSLNRLRRIAQVLTQHGFGHAVSQVNLARFVPARMLRRKKQAVPVDEGAPGIGRRLAIVCAELGPTFIKLGQLMSTRPDILPADVLTELRKLQDDVPPFDTSTAMQIIAEELGRPVSECYESIDKAPFASGSIGQVYRARAKDGTDLVVKVRRPGIEETIRIDMLLLDWLASSMENLMPELRPYRPVMFVAELEQALTRELDYVNEASTTARFAAVFKDDSGVRIPAVHWDLCGPRVLTLEALPGINVETLLDEPGGQERPIDRRLVARRLADSYLKQIFEFGSFHADPHPGNILVEAPANVGLIDFGQVGTVTDEFMTELIVLVYACVNNEMDLVTDTLADMGAVGSDTDRRQLHRALQSLLYKYYGLPIKRIDLGTLLNEFAEVVRRHDVVIPRDMAMLSKALGTAAGVMVKLDPELDLVELLKPRLRRTLAERFSPARLARSGTLLGWDLISIVRRAPGQLREVLRRLATGSWQLTLRHENIERLIRELDRSSNRLAFSIVLAAIIVGSSVVVSADTALTLLGLKVQYFGIIGYILAGVLGLGLTWAIFRSGRLH
jgi:ubiquinone biosynthesis protein